MYLSLSEASQSHPLLSDLESPACPQTLGTGEDSAQQAGREPGGLDQGQQQYWSLLPENRGEEMQCGSPGPGLWGEAELKKRNDGSQVRLRPRRRLIVAMSMARGIWKDPVWT